MKKFFSLLIAIISIAWNSCNYGIAGASEDKGKITFYEVPLVCGAAPEIGCGSRLKPLFLDTEKLSQIKESWSNRQGTVIAIVWNDPVPGDKEKGQLLEPVFEKHFVDADFISDNSTTGELLASFQKDKWYKGMDVDLLSVEEAGVIARSLTTAVSEAGIISNAEAATIKKDIEDYFKTELTQVRTYENLKSDETQDKWRKEGYKIFVAHIGEERANQVSDFYAKWNNGEIYEKTSGKSCCDKKNTGKSCCKPMKQGASVVLESTVTCPNCGHQKKETMPTESCLIRYECEKCKTVLNPKENDCCVFCSYGSLPCPSKQG